MVEDRETLMVIKRRKIKRGRVEIIPMVDTIVILLIFYMTFSRFAEMVYDAKVELPSSVAGDEFEKRPDQIIVNMFSGDDIRVGRRETHRRRLAHGTVAGETTAPHTVGDRTRQQTDAVSRPQ